MDDNPFGDDDEESQLEDEGALEIVTGPEIRSYTLNDLMKWTVYDITLLASTVVGDGPTSDPIEVRTDEDGRWRYL